MDDEVPEISFTHEEIDRLKIQGYGSWDWIQEDLEDEKEHHRLIQYIERIVRGSYELKSYRDYLKESVRFDHCTILSGIPASGLKKIEMHHHPFCLYDLCKITLESARRWNQRVSPLLVAERVVEDHYRNEVGLVPLTETIHEMVHAGQILIDPRCIFGDWLSWARRHAPLIREDQELLARVRARVRWSDEAEVGNIRRLEIVLGDWSSEGGALALEEVLGEG